MAGKIVDWKRNNKIGIRNFSESCDLHDIIKLMLVRMLRRKHKDSRKEPIYTEFDPEAPLDDFPDVWARFFDWDKHKFQRAKVYVWEVQRGITKEWKEKILKQYEDIDDVFIIDVNDIEKKLNLSENPLKTLREELEKYII